MASVVLHPDPQKIPPGKTVKLFPRPKTPWTETGRPPGTETTSAVVSAEGVLTFTGLTEGSDYLGWVEVSGVDQYLSVHVDVASATGSVSSVNGKEGAVTLTATDVEAVGTASPTFTGTVTVPTATEGDNGTKAASTKYADRSATAAGASAKTEAESGAATKDATAKTTTLSEAATAAASKDATLKGEAESKDATVLSSAESAAATKDSTAKTTTLSEAATAAAGKDATLKTEAEAKDTTAREAAEAASIKRPTVHASITTEVTAEPDELSPVDATSGSLKIKLKTGLGAGRFSWIEKSDSSANTVTAEGNMRGEAGKTLVLKSAKQTVGFVTDSSGSWWPIADHITNSALKSETRGIERRSLAFGAGVVPPNEVVLDEYVKIESGEVREILWVEVHTTSGTIKVKFQRGEAGETEISAYNALEATSSIKLGTTAVSLADKDRLRITLSSGSSPKGLWITWAEKAVAP